MEAERSGMSRWLLVLREMGGKIIVEGLNARARGIAQQQKCLIDKPKVLGSIPGTEKKRKVALNAKVRSLSLTFQINGLWSSMTLPRTL